MKTLFFIISGLGARAGAVLFAAALLFSGCTSESGRYLRADTPEGGVEISATDTSDHPVRIEASASWMVDTESGPDWFDVRYDLNDPNLLWTSANVRNESLDSLITEITVVSGDGLRLMIPFVQLPMEVDFGVTPRTLDPFGPRDTSTRTLTVTIASSLEWEWLIVGESDWLQITRGSGDEANRLSVGVTPTRLLDPRRDTIVVRPVLETFHSYYDSIAVVQRGIDLVIDSEAMNSDTYEIEIPGEGGEIMLAVYSRAEWTASADAPADRVVLGVASGGPDIENGTPMAITVAPNTSTEEYAFTLTFTSVGETYEYICRQQGGQPSENDPPGRETDGETDGE